MSFRATITIWTRFPKQIATCVLVTLVAASSSGASVPLPARASGYPVADFKVFDALSFRKKPDFGSLGLRPIRVIERFWPAGSAKKDVNLSGIISELAKLGDYQGQIYIDIEHWPVSGVPAEVALHNIEKLAVVADAARKAAPACQFGYYGIMPAGAYWDIIGQDPAKLAAWRETNLRTEKLAQHLDVMFPSLYTFYNDEKGWEQAARTLLIEARRYGKPVYAFLWPEFHDSNKQLGGTTIPVEFWRKQLALCRELSDGVVLWGGWVRNREDGRWVQRDWDEGAGWWIETQRFLSEAVTGQKKPHQTEKMNK